MFLKIKEVMQRESDKKELSHQQNKKCLPAKTKK